MAMFTLVAITVLAQGGVAGPAGLDLSGLATKLLEQSPIAGAIIFVMWLMLKRMDRADDARDKERADEKERQKQQADTCHAHQAAIASQCTEALKSVATAVQQNTEALGHNDATHTAVMQRLAH